MNEVAWPDPGSDEECRLYRALQRRVPDLYRHLSTYPRTPQTVVVVPSLSLDPRELAKITGVWHYEERMLVNLMLLRQPRTKVVFVSSAAIDPLIVDYYLSMLPGVPPAHARKRLVMMHCGDHSNLALSEKILARPRLMAQIRDEIRDPGAAHLVCFNSTDRERTLAVRLGIPLNSVDPALHRLGTKSGCREVFREAGILFPDGFENLASDQEMAEALAALKKRHPDLSRSVVKLDEGFSGEGNAVFRYTDGDEDMAEDALARAILERLPTQLAFEAPAESWEAFSDKFADMHGVVEAWVEGDDKVSPSAQCRVNGIGLPQVISTHDQVLGGPSGQVFMGCTFPADDAYRMEIQESAALIASVLADHGVIGRFGIDYVSVPTDEGWKHYAIEINLRKGGTTHPFLTLKFLTDGSFDSSDGQFYSASGRPKVYVASDNVQSDRYIGLRPEDLLDIAVFHGLHFHQGPERGVVFHLLGALSQFGKLGLVAIGDNPAQAHFLYKKTLEVLDEETGVRRGKG